MFSHICLFDPNPTLIFPSTPSFPTHSRDSCALACLCSVANAALRESRWWNAVRFKSNGAVLEPSSGAFNVTVALGESVQAAVDACPRGGSVLLLPGIHAGPLVLTAGQEVHVFGRGLATLQSSAGTVVTCSAAKATLDGLSIRQNLIDLDEDGDDMPADAFGLLVLGGALRLQACDVCSMPDTCIFIDGGNPTIISSKIHDAGRFGIVFSEGVHGRVVDSEVWGAHQACVDIMAGSDSSLVACKIHGGMQEGITFWGASTCRVEKCDLWGHHASGILAEAGATPVIVSCKIHDVLSSGVSFRGALTRGRLEDCDIWLNTYHNVSILNHADPQIVSCNIHLGRSAGVLVSEHGRGTLDGCEIAGNGNSGVRVLQGGNPTIFGCNIHDHALNIAAGVYVSADAVGNAAVGAGNVFARNVAGDVVRM